MAKKLDNIVESLRAGLADYEAHKSGARPLKETKLLIPKANVKAIRNGFTLSQREFADRFGLSVASLRNWEQGYREPEQPISLLLHLIAKYPNEIAQEVDCLKRAIS